MCVAYYVRSLSSDYSATTAFSNAVVSSEFISQALTLLSTHHRTSFINVKEGLLHKQLLFYQLVCSTEVEHYKFAYQLMLPEGHMFY